MGGQGKSRQLLSAVVGLEVVAGLQPVCLLCSFLHQHLQVNWFRESIQPKTHAIQFQVVSFQLDDLSGLAGCGIAIATSRQGCEYVAGGEAGSVCVLKAAPSVILLIGIQLG